MKKKFSPGTFIIREGYTQLIIGWHRGRKSLSINEIDHWHYFVFENSSTAEGSEPSLKTFEAANLMFVKNLNEF